MSVKGSCHCGATQFEVEAAPEEVTQCTCSLAEPDRSAPFLPALRLHHLF